MSHNLLVQKEEQVAMAYNIRIPKDNKRKRSRQRSVSIDKQPSKRILTPKSVVRNTPVTKQKEELLEVPDEVKEQELLRLAQEKKERA